MYLKILIISKYLLSTVCISTQIQLTQLKIQFNSLLLSCIINCNNNNNNHENCHKSGRAFSMSRLDQLAQPIRRNGEHIRAILERERREQMELLDETESLGGGRRRSSKPRHGSGSSSAGAGGGSSAMSRSMTHLASGRAKYTLSSNSTGGGGGGVGGIMSNSFRPLSGGQRDTTCKSLTQLNNSWSSATPRSNLGLQTAATRKYLQSSLASSPSAIGTKRSEQLLNHLTNPYRFDPNSLLIMNSSFSITTGVCVKFIIFFVFYYNFSHYFYS